MSISLWTCSRTEEDGHLVVARNEDEARRLYMAVTGLEVGYITVSKPEWRLGGEPPTPGIKMLGIWVPADTIMAGYGFVPSDDWRECPCCGLVLAEEDWDYDADRDECDSCAEAP